MTQNNPQPNVAFACTSLRIKDKQGNIYHGRTLEFEESPLISSFTYFPVDHAFQHKAPDGSLGLKYTAKYPIMALTMPQSADEMHDCLEGINAAGLSFSLNMYHNKGLKTLTAEQYPNSVRYEAIGEWGLANFATVQEIKDNLAQVDFWSAVIEVLGIQSPFHFIFYDKTGACLVIEVENGELAIYDNPTGVMTNGPELPWHLTNLHNYSHLTNIDTAMGNVGGMQLLQPDSGIASAALPSSNTSVGRFVKAFYYSSFANQVDNPDEQIIELSHVMNNFDRPKNISVVISEQGTKKIVAREYTVWTALTDLSRGYLYVRAYSQLNYTLYTFEQFKDKTTLYSFEIN